MKWYLCVIIMIVVLAGCSSNSGDYEGVLKDYSKIQNKTVVSESLNSTNSTNETLEIIELKYSYNIGSYNIPLTKTMMDNQETRNIINRIISDYDIIAIQGISNSKVIEELSNNYNVINSSSYGSGLDKEYYLFITSNHVDLLNYSSYPDFNNEFERPPFTAHYRIENYSFIIIQAHLDKNVAEQEIQSLAKVVNWSKEYYKEVNVYIMGTLYADCLYYSITNKFLNDYKWVLNDRIDTTTNPNSDCAYDRIIMVKKSKQIILPYIGVDELEWLDNSTKRSLSNHKPLRMVLE